MIDNQNTTTNYAHLPEDLIVKILEAVPATVDKFNDMFDTQDQPISEAIQRLRDDGMIGTLGEDTDKTDSLIAVDGGNVIDKMAGADVILAVAVGVEGLRQDSSSGWQEGKNQYYQWQTVLPHDEATSRLCQGVMFLMELSVLSNANHEFRIMDGAHFTPILKVNSMLSAKDENVGPAYADALRDFLRDTYEKIIPDIPDIVKDAFENDSIIAITKYSSSKDILDSYLRDSDIQLDDKTFFSLGLEENEYLKPLSAGQSEDEKSRIWAQLHITCNLELPDDVNLLNDEFKKAILPLRTKDNEGNAKESDLFYTYYKPYSDGPAYRIEVKRTLAEDTPRFEKCLASLRSQIIFPEIREPYPQYVVDLMAKSVSGGLYAIQDAIRLSPKLNIGEGRFDLLLPYRT